MIDTNGDGHITKDEWLAYQKRVFAALDRKGTGDIDEAEFYRHRRRWSRLPLAATRADSKPKP